MRRNRTPLSGWRRWLWLLGRLVLTLFTFLQLAAAWIWVRYRFQPSPATVRGQILFPGAVYDREIRRLPRPLVVHFVTVDLTTPGLRYLVTPPDKPGTNRPLRGRSTSAFLQETGASLAINGDFFYPWKSNTMLDYYPHVGEPVTVQGYASSNGVPYGDNRKRWKLPALCFSKEGEASIRVLKPDETPPHNAVGGDRFLLQEGKITKAASESDALHPRTAVALDRSGKHLILLLVDGRQAGYSEGATTEELARLFQERGAYTALNLDGGGSTTLAIRDEKGKLQMLNSSINHWYFPRNERVVANHLAIFAPP